MSLKRYAVFEELPGSPLSEHGDLFAAKLAADGHVGRGSVRSGGVRALVYDRSYAVGGQAEGRAIYRVWIGALGSIQTHDISNVVRSER